LNLVIDASAVLTWLLPDEHDERADQLLETIPGHAVFAPAIWPIEVINAVRSAVLRQRVPEAEARLMAEAVGKLHVHLEAPDPSTLRSIYQLAERHQLSAYDASYLELAVRLSHPLATFDHRLADAAREHAVPLWFEDKP